MIGKVSRGSTFGGLQAYLVRGQGVDGEWGEGLQGYLLGGGGRVEWTAVRNLPADDPELAATIMTATAAQNGRVQKPVYHLSLAAGPDEELSREQWERVADRVLGELGLEEHQVLVVAHNDTEHPHIHLMINRVHPRTLKAWDNGHDYYRIERALRHIERDMDLRRVPGHHYRLEGQERPEREGQETGGEQARRERTGEASWADEVRFRTYEVFRGAQSWRELEAGLAEHGLRLQRRGGGLVVTDGERQVKASRIYRRGSYKWLEARFGRSFEERREGREEHAGRDEVAASREPGGGREAEGEEAEGEEAVVQRIRFRAYNVLRSSRNWGELERGLAGQGLRLRRRGGGLVVADGRDEVAASRIYRRASYGWLERRYGMSFEQWREGRRELLAAVDRYQEGQREVAWLDRELGETAHRWKEAERMLRQRREARAACRRAARVVGGLLAEIYRPEDLPRARRRIAREARREGWEETARRVGRRPWRYGRVKGGVVRDVALRRWGRGVGRRVVSAGAELAVSRAARLVAGPVGYRAVGVALAARRKMEGLWAKKDRKDLGALQLEVARRALSLGMSAVRMAVSPTPLRVIRTAVRSARLVRSLGRAAGGVVRGGGEREGRGR